MMGQSGPCGSHVAGISDLICMAGLRHISTSAQDRHTKMPAQLCCLSVTTCLQLLCLPLTTCAPSCYFFPPRSFVSFRVPRLPAFTGSLTACVTFYEGATCSTLGDFCYGYDYLGGCQYTITDQPQSCCPTSLTSYAAH
jgi:hypothetical protein